MAVALIQNNGVLNEQALHPPAHPPCVPACLLASPCDLPACSSRSCSLQSTQHTDDLPSSPALQTRLSAASNTDNFPLSLALQTRLSAASNTVLFHAYVIAKLSNPAGDIQLAPVLANPARSAYLKVGRCWGQVWVCLWAGLQGRSRSH